jgi:hypothetical protein
MAPSEKRWLGGTDKFVRLRRIEQLDLDADFQEIAALFLSDFQAVMLPMGFAGFLMTYAAPRMSRILSATGQLEHSVEKRAIDTVLLMSIITAHGVRESPGRDAARVVNAMHRRYDIHQEDFVAVGCDSALKAIELAETFGWRPVTDKEREAVRRHFAAVTRALGGRKRFPESIGAMRAFMEHYMKSQFRFEQQNRRLAEATCRWYVNLVPWPLRPFFRVLLLSAVDPQVIRFCGLRAPSALARWAGRLALKWVGRCGPVPDEAPDGLEALVRIVYPSGYQLEDLGTAR